MKAVLLFSCINCYCILVRMPQNKKGALLFIIFLQSWVRRDKICQRNLTKTEIGSKVDRKLPSWLHSMQGGDRNALLPGGCLGFLVSPWVKVPCKLGQGQDSMAGKWPHSLGSPGCCEILGASTWGPGRSAMRALPTTPGPTAGRPRPQAAISRSI